MENLSSYSKNELYLRAINDENFVGVINSNKLVYILSKHFIFTNDQVKTLLDNLEIDITDYAIESDE